MLAFPFVLICNTALYAVKSFTPQLFLLSSNASFRCLFRSSLCFCLFLISLPPDFEQTTKFDVDAYLKNEYARRFGRCEERVFLTGDGYDEPKGIIHSAEVGVTTESITYDDVIKLYFSLKPEYRKKAVWIVNDETALKIRTLKSANGDYLWNQHDNTILGRPVEYSEFMPSEAAGAKPIVFGDLTYYYVLQRNPLSVRPLVV